MLRVDVLIPLGVIIGTGPPQGQVVATGSTIGLVVSAAGGPPVNAPNILGATSGSAVSALMARRLTPSLGCEQSQTPSQNGTVIAQVPQGPVIEGSTIYITIGKPSC
jgi:beta-lactam-binding protein with PASTA domain